ncbi:hypothetical protein [Streptomyces sp. Root369]|uniref:hypothetical protein n=1 Tax=Streptomyces sp. Root369 TaxID=1736523 RepID=UPI00070FF35A|nr:hypothetical protein [Streptomyces sp. Root369]KQW13594.1 hypothetical protein ASD08_31005 [Streptomyces sp. Root369]
MIEHLTGDAAVAAALAHLLADHPELSPIVWTIGEKPGVLSGCQLMAETGDIIESCAKAMGGTIAHSTQNLHGDSHGVAQLLTTFDGVPVHVWASYPLPGTALYADHLRDLLSGRRAAEGGDAS